MSFEEEESYKGLGFSFNKEDNEDDIIVDPNNGGILLITRQSNFCKIRRVFHIETFGPFLG